jgi:hypothetical protein
MVACQAARSYQDLGESGASQGRDRGSRVHSLFLWAPDSDTDCSSGRAGVLADIFSMIMVEHGGQGVGRDSIEWFSDGGLSLMGLNGKSFEMNHELNVHDRIPDLRSIDR